MYSRANSSRTSSTCARAAPTASARSRTSVSSRPCPRSSVTAITSAPYCSASHAMAIDVSRPPEYARTIRSISTLPLDPLVELPREDLRLAIAAANHEDGVLAADRADHFRQPRPVDGFGQRLRLRRLGAQDDELLHHVELAQGAGHDTPEDGAGVGGGGPFPHRGARVIPIGRRLYQAAIAGVPPHPGPPPP